ncbi:MAG: OmpA family protein [Lutibacter sp.]|jgi:outer membrane protein OmpA-like peptidoglycan-associated protein|uniref:OmpA family protein n=1 Tax=Lutibacter sp. TaxID=1925666 RepID=UPI00299CFDB2|nr:OmpA family protein [Lutibacter sp.]MDX1829047.1 OmpA family protein [Lutibacter sp.]
MKKIYTIAVFLIGFIISLNAQTTEDQYSIKNLSINTELSNFGTSFYGSDKLIFSQPVKRKFIINNVWKPNNQPYLDLYIGDIQKDGEISNIKKFSSKLNTRYHEADVCFSKDKKTVYFSRSNFQNGRYKKDSLGVNRIKLFKAVVGPNNEWTNVEPLPFNNDNYSVGHPALSDDGKTLYFISDMPGTLGKTDIFKVAINSDGTYGTPVNLGPKINTPEREMFPFVSGNNELYFSSDGREGFGMLDVFKAAINNDGTYGGPVNLGGEINSDKDDFAFIIDNKTLKGYFSSNRSEGKGDDDIYFFKEIPVICKQNVNIVVIDKQTKAAIPNAVVSITKNEEDLPDVTVDKDGKYLFVADCDTKYSFASNKMDYFYPAVLKTITTSSKKDDVQTVVLEMNRELINLNTIYFDFDKYNIRPDAAVELDKVVAYMKKYPTLKVEVGSHTDSRGSFKYNEKLSEKRAESTVEYIVSKGIDSSRITAKGYGERNLVNKCSDGVKCIEEEHQLNRRTEFVITNPEFIKN